MGEKEVWTLSCMNVCIISAKCECLQTAQYCVFFLDKDNEEMGKKKPPTAREWKRS